MKKVDLTNQIFGKLTVIEPDYSKKRSAWLCKCECGNECIVLTSYLINGDTRSCGCLFSEDLTGKQFQRLKVVEKTSQRDSNYNVFYKCKCECGKEKLVTATDLKKGNVRSCGCLSKETSTRIGKFLGDKTKEQCIDGTNVRNLTMKTSKRNTSGIKGVTWDKTRSKWKAQIIFKGKNYYLGRYSDIEEARKAREVAEEKIFGEFLEWYNKKK